MIYLLKDILRVLLIFLFPSLPFQISLEKKIRLSNNFNSPLPDDGQLLHRTAHLLGSKSGTSKLPKVFPFTRHPICKWPNARSFRRDSSSQGSTGTVLSRKPPGSDGPGHLPPNPAINRFSILNLEESTLSGDYKHEALSQRGRQRRRVRPEDVTTTSSCNFAGIS